MNFNAILFRESKKISENIAPTIYGMKDYGLKSLKTEEGKTFVVKQDIFFRG